MDYQNIIQQIRRREFAPVYFLDGQEPFFIDQILQALEKTVVPEEQRSFNQSILYGKEVDGATIVAEARRYPMMADHVLVVVREAQHLRKEQLEHLLPYIEQPNPTTVLAIGYKSKKLDGRSKLKKTIEKQGVYFHAKPVYENQLPRWIESHAHTLGLRLDTQAIRVLSACLGTDLGRIHSEMIKLQLVAEEGRTISAELAARQVGIHKDYNVFELTRALSYGDKRRIIQIAEYARANPKELNAVMVVSILTTYFEKIIRLHSAAKSGNANLASAIGVQAFLMREYEEAARRFPLRRAAKAMELLLQCDKRLKGLDSGITPPEEWLRELLIKFNHLSVG